MTKTYEEMKPIINMIANAVTPRIEAMSVAIESDSSAMSEATEENMKIGGENMLTAFINSSPEIAEMNPEYIQWIIDEVRSRMKDHYVMYRMLGYARSANRLRA